MASQNSVHRVVVTYINGHQQAGYVRNFSPADRAIRLSPNDSGPPTTEDPFSAVQAIAFYGSPQCTLDHDPRARVIVRFTDGTTLKGEYATDRNDGGFWLYPRYEEASPVVVFVPADAPEEITVVPVITEESASLTPPTLRLADFIV